MTYRFVKFHTGPSGRTRTGRVKKKIKGFGNPCQRFERVRDVHLEFGRELTGGPGAATTCWQPLGLPVYVKCMSPKGSWESLMIPPRSRLSVYLPAAPSLTSCTARECVAPHSGPAALSRIPW